MKVLLINGPNLNMVGIREKNIYGTEDFAAICDKIQDAAQNRGIDLTMRQSNLEGEIVTWIQQAYFDKCDGIILNPGAYTHYSYAIYDAIKAVSIPTVEIHLSNIHARDEFRKKSVTAAACIGQICGFGSYGYVMAMDALINEVQKKNNPA